MDGPYIFRMDEHLFTHELCVFVNAEATVLTVPHSLLRAGISSRGSSCRE